MIPSASGFSLAREKKRGEILRAVAGGKESGCSGVAGAARESNKLLAIVYRAALDPTHHQRGCHPARRSNPSAPRQGIKTASANRKIGRESSTLTYPAEGRRRQVPAAIDPVARRRRRTKTLKRMFTAPPSIQHTISAGAIPRAGRIRQPLAKG